MGFFSSPKHADDDDEPAQATVRYCSCLPQSSATKRKRLERNRNRTDLLNSFAKFSPASVHAELLEVCPPTSPSVRDILSKSTRRLPAACDQPSARPGRGALLFVDISGFTALSTSLGIDALKRHINEIYTRAVGIIARNGGDVLKFAGDAMLVLFPVAGAGEGDLDGACALAAKCALELTKASTGGVHKVDEDGVSAVLRMHCAIGCGSYYLYRVGDRDRWESVIAGEPLQQITVAEPCASAGMTACSPEVWPRLERKGYKGKKTHKECRIIQAQPRRNSFDFGFRRDQEEPSLIQLQHQGNSSSRLTQKAHMSILKTYLVPSVREIFEQLGDSGSLSPDKKKSLVEKAPEDHLAEQRKVSTVFVEIRNLEDALLSGDLDRVQTCFLTIKLCVEDKRGMLRQFIVDDKGVVAIAFFGVRGHSFEDNEYRAAHVALAIVSALKRYDLRAKCGVTVGVGFCGLVGAPNRCEYAVMGPSVNLAARLMCAAAKSDKDVYVESGIERATSVSPQARLCVFNACEPIKAKGFSEMVKVFSLEEAAKDRAHTLTHEDVAFTGNDDVLRDISAVLDAVRGDSRAGSEYSDDESDGEEFDIGDACRVISVDGESGLGKSRLLREVRSVHQSEWKCVEAHADEVSQGRPFAVWLSIIRNLLTVRMSEPEPKALGRESPLTLDDSAHELLHLSALASKVGKALDKEEEEEQPYEGGERAKFIHGKMTRSQRVKFGGHLSCFDEEDEELTGSPVFKREFLGAVFAALTSSQGKGFLPRRTLILLDNAHRLDAPSWELLEDLTAKPPARRGRARVVVVLAKRGGAELPAAWERLASFEDRILHLTLQPLDAFASSRLLCAALDVPLHAVTPATVENVRRKCAGLPVLVLALCDAIENHVRKLEDGQVDDVLPDDNEDRDAVRGMASPETREVVRSALRKVPCFINLDDEKKFSYVCHRLRRLHSAPGETVISEGEQGSTVYILLEGTMECFVAGVKVAEISEGTVVGERAMLTNAARSATVVAATACVSWVLERRHARYLMKEADGVWRRVLALESLSIPSPDDNSIMPSGLEGIITQKLDALSLNATTFAKLASAFGAVFHKEALRTCFPGPKDSGNDDAIDELVKAQLIVADSHGSDTQNTRAAQRLAWSQRIAEERGDLGGSVYGGGRASNYGDDFRSVAGDDLRSIAGDRMSCRGSVVGGDSSDVGSTETRLRSDSAEPVDHEDLLEKFRATERAKRNRRPAGLYRFRNQQIAEVIYGVVPDEQKREYHRRIAEFFEDCLCVLEGRECITHTDERRAIDTVVAALKLTTKDLHLLLADHSTKSRSLDGKAKEYSLLAARDATALGLYREAEQHYRRVVSMEQPSFVEEEVGKLSLAKAARLSAFLGLAELYARFELAPRPRDVDREQAPLGEGPIPLLTRGLEMLGVDSDELAEADFSAGCIAKNETELPNEELDLLARALNQLGWCLMRSGVALESRRRCRLTEGCFAHAVRIAKKRNDLPFAASALNGFGTFYQNCAQRVGREKNKRLCDVVLGDARTVLRKPSLKKQVSAKKFVKYQKVPPPQSGRRWGSASTSSMEEDDLYGSTLILERSALYKKAEGKLMEALRIREDGNGSHLDVAQVAVSLGSLTVEMAIFDAARAFFDLALRNYTFDESADAHPPVSCISKVWGSAAVSRHRRDSWPSHFHESGFFFDVEAVRTVSSEYDAPRRHPRAAHALAGLARVRRHQGSKMLQQRDSLSARRAGLLVLDEAINFQAQAVRSRASLGQRHGLYQASVAELRAMESQRDQVERAMKSADADAPPSPPSSMAASSPERGSPLREISPSGQVRVIAPTAPTLAECRGSPANTPRNGNPAPPHD